MSSHSEEYLESAPDCSSVDDESRSGTGTSASSTRVTGEDGDMIKDQLSRKETTAVFRLRVVVSLALLLAAAAVSYVVYFITRKAEMDAFEVQYEGAAEKVVISFTDIVEEIGAISGLGLAASAYSLDTKSEWPFVTLSNFQERARNARRNSGTLYVSINPVVDTEELDKWEEYVLSDNNSW
jgi:hypothetical protein